MANMPNNCKKLWDIKENKQTVMIYMCIEQPEKKSELLYDTMQIREEMKMK